MTHRRRTILLPTERSFKRGGSCVQNTYFATSRILSKISSLVSRFSLLSFHIFHPTSTSCLAVAHQRLPFSLPNYASLSCPCRFPFPVIPLFFDICRFYHFLVFSSSTKATSFDECASARYDPKRCDPKRYDRKQRASLPRDVQCSRRASDVVVAFLANGTK